MRIRPTILVLLVLAAMSVPTMLAARRLTQAHATLGQTRLSLRQTQVRVEQVRRLRSTVQRVDDAHRPKQDLIARVNAALASAGLPERHFGALNLGADATLPGRVGSGDLVYKRQSVRISLKQLALPEIGRFLAEWTRSQPLWTPQRIDLARPAGRNAGDRYDVTLVVETTYVDRRTAT
ncbi:MAG: hypothetical protein GY715_00785 [Planctomycetes bacterium]|nr:hypothetical protein [Planctomycetota bacterium]